VHIQPHWSNVIAVLLRLLPLLFTGRREQPPLP
jgi:hypothetical protein